MFFFYCICASSGCSFINGCVQQHTLCKYHDIFIHIVGWLYETSKGPGMYDRMLSHDCCWVKHASFCSQWSFLFLPPARTSRRILWPCISLHYSICEDGRGEANAQWAQQHILSISLIYQWCTQNVVVYSYHYGCAGGAIILVDLERHQFSSNTRVHFHKANAS